MPALKWSAIYYQRVAQLSSDDDDDKNYILNIFHNFNNFLNKILLQIIDNPGFCSKVIAR